MCVAKWQNNSSTARPIDFLRALFERLRNCETGEFAIVESLLNVLSTNVFQIHHGGREVLVTEPFLQFTNTADIACQLTVANVCRNLCRNQLLQ